ncbi:bifunctional diguanylate cyclase/phosphodiesterase [Litorilituus sediminis]|uniref:EAL domain-containing protein n=1 Tax=Litorilituus sediminis TaxID=718192 RepID=A0A4P6P2F5_9GAMM|nr:EAL domain-containing protein [Litorilituus sediminis]QBG34828.1 EAL domain-containing protein [Litorilituus sediminis]
MVEEKVKSIIDSLSHAATDNFADVICLSLAKATHADYVFIAELDEQLTRATSISLAAHGEIQENISYLLANSPCEHVGQGSVCSYSENCQQAFPEDQLLFDMNISGYVGVPLRNEAGQTTGILVALFEQAIFAEQDVRALFLLFSGMIKKEMEKQALISELNIRNEIIEESQEAIIVCDKNVEIISVNKAFTKISGYTFKEVKGKNPKFLGSGLTDKHFYGDMWQAIHETGSWSGEIWNKKKTGEIFPEWLSISTICDENNEVSYYVAFFFDISKRKASESKIYKQANFDLLTGLANRFLFTEQVALAVNNAISGHKKSAILHMDLDLFKEINDVYGHDFGDQLLIQAAERLQSYIKSTDCVARISGDGFAILLNDISNEYIVNAIVKRILAAFSGAFIIGDISIQCTLSIGITVFQEHEQVSDIMKRAETAMYHAKDSGRNSYCYFSQKMQDTALRKLHLKNQLSHAIENRQLNVVYQPIISIKDKRVNKFEALVRWNNQGEWVSPEEFIQIAEEFSLIKELGQLVLSQACLVLKQLKQQGFNDVVFNINRSVFEIPLNQSENKQWLNTIEHFGLQPSDICFELTESALAPDKRNNEILFNLLRESGCTIALDDFGTGYSSLAYVRRIPIDYIKIDRSFITDMSTNEDDNILVSTIIAMSKALGKKVVAEGVETKEQLDLLSALSCDYIQGYLFSKPLPAEQLANYLSQFNFDDY